MEQKADKSKGRGTSTGARSPFLPSVPDLDYTLKIVRDWIKECESHHEVCAVAADPQLPTRILDLGSTDSSQVKLLTFTSSLRGPYICLSYCWGKSQNLPSQEPLQTDESNCSTWTEGIPWSLFPRTFQDAITLTRGLGLRYLWIDALCIMQGNSADWIRESANMASIYSNSYLTIAATAGPNPEHGLFFPRWTQWAAGHRQAIETVELTGLHLGHHRFVYAHKAMEHIEDAPLLTRAWTFQERLLPARTLHFHAEELIWECKSGMDCECSELKKVGWTVPSSDVTSGWMKVSMFSPQETSLEARSYKWLVAVSEFSKLHISAESDRVPALSGLSEIFSRFPGNVLGAYFSGIWRNDLARGLLYQRCEQMDGERLSPSDLKAFDHILPPPSWSWTRLFFNRRNELSYNIVLYCGFQKDRYFSIQTVQCSSLNANSFGWATNGRLEVSGRCVEVCLQAPCIVPVGQLEVEITLNKKAKKKLGLSDVDNATFVNDGQTVIDEQSRLLCLLVGSSREETPEWRYALILKQSTFTLEFHERVGILYIDKSNGWFPEDPESVEVVNIIIV